MRVWGGIPPWVREGLRPSNWRAAASKPGIHEDAPPPPEVGTEVEAATSGSKPTVSSIRWRGSPWHYKCGDLICSHR